jgi:NAD(P)H-hydrate epimerase
MLRALDGLAGVSVVDLSSAGQADWARALAPADVVVDALLGTGLRDDVRGVFAAAIAAINARSALTIAVDIPSGLDADTGRAHGCAVRADLTATMGARKLGLVLEPTAPVGELRVVDLGVPIVPPSESEATAFWIDEAGVRPSVPPRASTAYKGTAGHLIVVAGSEGKTGAAWLTARAALRAGAGLVTVASTAAGQIALDAKVVEAMTARFTDGDDADGTSHAAIEALLGAPSVRGLALGPGIPTGVGMRGLVNRLAREAQVPMVIDADGLNLLGERAADALKGAAAPRIVTPHPGEMGRLSGRSTADVQADRLGCARAFAAASGAIVVLKGARTLVATPSGQAFVNPAVEPALGTAGSGDVLTGVVGALLAQGLSPLDAAIAGVFLHGRAGARAGKTHGAPGTIASDLPEAIAAVRATLSA